MASLVDLLDELARVRVARPAELQAVLAISKATLSRLVAQGAGQIHRIGRARSIRYARTRAVEGLGRSVPVFRVRESGEPVPAGTLHLLWAGQHAWAPPSDPERLFVGLPPELADMSPQGYLGRSFPARFPELLLPPRVTDWSDDHRLVALARRGEDCVGDLVIGEESFARLASAEVVEVTPAAYPALAVRSALDAPGSSAGGEQPKFGAFREGRHRLVKFASAARSPTAQRWRDLLWCEWRALRMVEEAGHRAAGAELLDVEGWRFLDVERFDRVGARGRRATLTLGAMDDEYFGQRDSWTAAASRLMAAPFSLPREEAASLRWLDAFGQLIGNTDRHFGNVACFPAPDGTLRLAPAFDMLPTVLAPAGEELPARTFAPAPPGAANLDVWPDAARWAQRYWDAVASGDPLDGAVREFAGRAAAAVEAIARSSGAGG